MPESTPPVWETFGSCAEPPAVLIARTPPLSVKEVPSEGRLPERVVLPPLTRVVPATDTLAELVKVPPVMFKVVAVRAAPPLSA